MFKGLLLKQIKQIFKVVESNFNTINANLGALSQS